jgi:hypothetical protein
MRFYSIVPVAIAVLLAALPAAAETPPEINDDLMPYCWGVRSADQLPPQQVEQLSKKFGAKADRIDNITINAAGLLLKVNIVHCPTEKDAITTREFFSKMGLSDDNCVRAGRRVYEFRCDNKQIVAKMKSLLGLLDDSPRKWRVQMEVAPLDRSHDDMKWNQFFNATLAHNKNPEDEDAIIRILDLAPNFEFGNSLAIRSENTPWGGARYKFTPEPSEQSRAGDRLIAAFDDLPRTVEVPRINIEAEITTQSFGVYQPGNLDDHYKYALLRATDPWPVAHGEIRRVLAECYELSWTPRRNVESILCWVYHNIEFKGEVTGSRYGALKVLEQRYGHCWDKTDVFITMCRMVNIPCRQVYGWLSGVSGHVWAQVYLEDEGWISVDPTTSWLGVTDDYIPLFISEDGHPPFVYTDFPEITPMD